MKMSQPLRIDYPKGIGSFVTRRIRNSQLVFINNSPLEARVLGALGRYIKKYGVIIYGYTIFGSHDHDLLSFKPKTKSDFFRDFGARTAEAVKKYVPGFGGGSVFEKRASEQAVTADKESHLDRLMYTILQPIKAGLCKNLSDYPGFNSFQYMLSGKPLEVEWFNGEAYTKARRRKKDVDPTQFIEKYDINFAKLPGYEHLSQSEYRQLLMAEYEERRKKIIEAFDKAGHKWPPVASLRTTRPTEFAKNPKKSTRESKRPLVLSLCMERKQEFLDYYFSKLVAFKKASYAYLNGDRHAEFPEGTCIPPGPWC